MTASSAFSTIARDKYSAAAAEEAARRPVRIEATDNNTPVGLACWTAICGTSVSIAAACGNETACRAADHIGRGGVG